MKRKNRDLHVLILSVVCSLFLIPQLAAESFEAMAITNTPSPGFPAKVLLTWEEVTKYDGINIYRKKSSSESYPELPINSELITRISDCTEIRTLIPIGSELYETLKQIEWPPVKGDKHSIIAPPSTFLRKKFDPCIISTVIPRHSVWEMLQFFSRSHYNLSLILGQAFIDTGVTNGTAYNYQIRGVKGTSETIVKANIPITAGIHIPLPAPGNIQVQGGDSEVLITWENVVNATGYDVYRRIYPAGTIKQINDGPVVAVVTHNLDGDSISAAYGMIDYRRWDENGVPITHEVQGIPIAGPANGTIYQYQVIARDILDLPGNPSPFSNAVSPTDSTPPGLPGDLQVEAIGPTLKITWSKVIKDQQGRLEMDGLNGYNIYRSDDQNEMNPAKLNFALIPNPISGKVEFTDSDPTIISYYGEKEFYYRIDCVDANGNQGVLSSASSGHTDDIYPPDITINVKAEGFSEYIRIMWTSNNEPDMMSYEIYRALCHLGEWPDPRGQEKTGISGGDFALIGEISHWEAVELENSYGQAYFDDYSVPTESPLCYAYWVKSRDSSQNLSGDWPYPSNIEKANIVCQRLRDETPPPSPIVTAVQARDEAIYLEWIAAPSQDLGAFHVYRSNKENTDYNWEGGITVEEPPTPPVSLSFPYNPTTPPGCDEIPLVAHEGMNAGFWMDKKVDPKKIYWYKITSVDQNGNESDLNESVPYSTFTFKLDGPPTPIITNTISYTDSCELEIIWTPNYLPEMHKGFVVFRSSKETGYYRQISTMLQESRFIDRELNKSISYWYKIQAFDKQGRPSRLSNAYQARLEE